MSISLYGEALLDAAAQVHIRSEDGGLVPLSTAQWCAPLDTVDEHVVDHLDGPTLDIGCGPGRFVTGVGARGLPVLGIDVTPIAIEMTRRRGGLALSCDVFGRVPGAGRWKWALLMDGNVGIGGAPKRLLRRTAELLAPDGRALVEVGPPGGPNGSQRVRLETDGRVGHWFPWAWVNLDDLPALAARSSLVVQSTWGEDGRWFAELART